MRPTAIRQFRQQVYDYYEESGRHDLPWRQPEAAAGFDPYKILVSEMMLQQTQVQRVIPKYHSFLAQFPDITSLAAAPLGSVLRAWSGLGYNRRAKFLQHTARQLDKNFAGTFPADPAALVTLPGIGVNTAGAIAAYAFNKPAVFIETNIRTVFRYHFFNNQKNVSDSAILNVVAQCLDSRRPRVWYWAVMDYGSFLKRAAPAAAVANTARQSPFIGSRRQIRGAIIRLLGERSLDSATINRQIRDERVHTVLNDLVREGLIQQADGVYSL
jgi:A/G-specific adenine glycosylase